MALYAVDDDDLIYAGQAEPGKIYWCLDCFGPVKRRRGKSWFPHFYHLKSSPKCRLYSKTEDHLLAQMQLQKLFPEGALQIERPFITINRVADLCWEQEKVVFEIQCSSLTEKEGEMRIRDYKSAGYDVIWLLHDKRYNKQVIRPAEDYLRKQSTYYMTLRRGLNSEYYDQFEVFAEGKRVKKGRQMPIDLRKIRRTPKISFNEELFPKQIIQLNCPRYFIGDRTDRALRNYSLSMQNWRGLEIQLGKPKLKVSKWRQWIWTYIGLPYLDILRKWH